MIRKLLLYIEVHDKPIALAEDIIKLLAYLEMNEGVSECMISYN